MAETPAAAATPRDLSQDIARRMDGMEFEKHALVSLDAKALEAKGHTVYHFHLGDLDFKTPPHIIQACKDALDAGKTGYCGPFGLPRLRELLADKIGKQRGVVYDADDVVVQPGGKPIILKYLMSVANPGDEILYPVPGFPTYESIIAFLEGTPRPYFYTETADNSFCLDMDYLHSLMRRNYTQPDSRPSGRYRSKKILILNNQHNPLGVSCTRSQLAQIAEWCNAYDVIVLSDEAYFDLVFDQDLKMSIASFPGMRDRTVILYTFSKVAAMTGWRLGAAIGPRHVISKISVVSSNHDTCTTHFVQCAGIAALESPLTDQFTAEMVAELRRRRDCLVAELQTVPGFKVNSPDSTFYLFTNITEAMRLLGSGTVEEFRQTVIQKTGVAFALRQHFGSMLQSPLALGTNQQYARFCFSAIGVERIKEGIASLRKFMQSQGNATPAAKKSRLV